MGIPGTLWLCQKLTRIWKVKYWICIHTIYYPSTLARKVYEPVICELWVVNTATSSHAASSLHLGSVSPSSPSPGAAPAIPTLHSTMEGWLPTGNTSTTRPINTPWLCVKSESRASVLYAVTSYTLMDAKLSWPEKTSLEYGAIRFHDYTNDYLLIFILNDDGL